MRAFAYLNINAPWIAWLVYRGEMVSPRAMREQALSVWHANYLIDIARSDSCGAYYKRERDIEAVRLKSFSRSVSRLSGLYFFQDADSAKRAGRRWDGNFRDEHLTEIEIVGNPVMSQYDSEWITHKMHSDDLSWIPSYLSGTPMGSQPLWELLVEGRAFILGTRVREMAYETVKRTWPRSMGLLELSRVAVQLNSDLGLICPVVKIDGSTARLTLELEFADARNPEFLQRFSLFDGPKNTADLNALVPLVTPDLSDLFVEFKI